MRHRLIRPNKSCQVPSQHIILDTETIPGEPFGPRQTRIHKFRLACACFFRWENGLPTREKWICTYSSQELLKWVENQTTLRRMTWIWAHSAKFDWTCLELWNAMSEKQFALDYASIDGKPNFLMTRVGKKSAWWIDSLNWFPMSLAELGESVGLEKWPMPGFAAPDAEWAKYCRRDVAILRSAVTDLLSWIVENDMGCLRISAPGQALQAYRHRFAPRVKMVLPTKHKDGSETMEEKEVCLPLTHSVGSVKELERRAYFQGTVRTPIIGEVNGPIYCLDVNSCYPSVMLDGLVPTELLNFDCSLGNSDSFPANLIGECIADVKISTQTPDYPLRQSGHCVYPVGTFWTTLCGPELLHAHARKRIIQFGRWAKYKLANIFGPYVRCIWDMRCGYRDRKDLGKEALCKWLLNSLPGKFGQRSHRWEKDTKIDWPEPWGRFDIVNYATKEVKHYRSIAWLIEREQKPGEHPESFPAVSAWITSLARIKMLEILEVAKSHGQVYYSAVDSVHCSYGSLSGLSIDGKIGSKIGMLRLEREAKRVAYRGIANYSIDGEMHVAGLPRKAEITRPGVVVSTKLEADIRAYRNGRPNRILEYNESRSITPSYVHGRLNPDSTTRPWILPLEESEMRCALEKSQAIGIFA